MNTKLKQSISILSVGILAFLLTYLLPTELYKPLTAFILITIWAAISFMVLYGFIYTPIRVVVITIRKVANHVDSQPVTFNWKGMLKKIGKYITRITILYAMFVLTYVALDPTQFFNNIL